MDVIAKSETTKQSPSFERGEILASHFGLLPIATPKIRLDGVVVVLCEGDMP
jgi:hypothetical protein